MSEGITCSTVLMVHVSIADDITSELLLTSEGTQLCNLISYTVYIIYVPAVPQLQNFVLNKILQLLLMASYHVYVLVNLHNKNT